MKSHFIPAYCIFQKASFIGTGDHLINIMKVEDLKRIESRRLAGIYHAITGPRTCIIFAVYDYFCNLFSEGLAFV